LHFLFCWKSKMTSNRIHSSTTKFVFATREQCPLEHCKLKTCDYKISKANALLFVWKSLEITILNSLFTIATYLFILSYFTTPAILINVRNFYIFLKLAYVELHPAKRLYMKIYIRELFLKNYKLDWTQTLHE
jgi:hypothetical protein